MTAKVDKLAKDSQVSELHQEMKQSMSELVGVTEEIRAGFNPMAVGRKILQEESGGGNPRASPSSQPSWQPRGGGAEWSSAGHAPPRVHVKPNVPSGSGTGFAAAGAGVGGGSSGTQSSAAIGAAAMAAAAGEGAPTRLPFSAVSVGRTRLRPEITGWGGGAVSLGGRGGGGLTRQD